MIPALEHATASELATFVVALLTVAASPPSLPADLESETTSLRREMARLRNAPSDAERARLQDLAATFSKNAFVWIGVPSSEKHEALMAIRAVIPALEPDPARLKANVDLVTDKMASMLAVELSNVGPAAPLDAPDPSADGELVADIRDVRLAPEAAPGGAPSEAGTTPAGEIRPEMCLTKRDRSASAYGQVKYPFRLSKVAQDLMTAAGRGMLRIDALDLGRNRGR